MAFWPPPGMRGPARRGRAVDRAPADRTSAMTIVPPENSTPCGRPRCQISDQAREDDDPRQHDRVPAPADEVEVRILEDLHGDSSRCSTCGLRCRRDSSSSNSVFDTKIDVNRLVSRPIDSVIAKPRIGPVPNWNRNARGDERRDVRVEQRQNTRPKPALTGRAHAALRRQLLLDALEDQHVRVDAHAHRQHEAGDARAASSTRRCTPSGRAG